MKHFLPLETFNPYIGLDFGTSNTSVSYISQSAIKTYEKRSTEKHWVSLNDLPKFLPYSLAAPLSKYLSESFDQSNRVKYAREFVEGALALAAYISYLEICASKGNKATKIFKGFTQRSLGPLWKLLKDSLHEIRKNSKFSTPYNELISEEFFSQIDEGVTFLGQNKHEKADDKDFNPRIINILANVSQKMFTDHKFGYFENIQQERFKSGSYKGIFRLATGYYGDFTDTIDYLGSFNFVNLSAHLVNFEDRVALPLDPLIFWYPCFRHIDQEHCYIYDKPDDRTVPHSRFSYKAAGLPCSLIISDENEELETVKNDLVRFMTEDPSISIINF